MRAAIVLACVLAATAAHSQLTGDEALRYYAAVGYWGKVVAEYRARPFAYAGKTELLTVAEAYYWLGELDAAEKIARAPHMRGDEDAAIVLALVNAARGRSDQAAGELQGLLDRGADPAKVHNALGVVKMRKDSGAALSHLEKAAAANSDYEKAWFNMGLIYEDREEFEQAIRAYGNAVRINPLHAQAQNNLAYSYKELHYYAYAVEHYQKAIELMPDNAGFYYNIGNAYTHQERIEEAFAAYKRALELDPTFSKAHYNMGRTYLRKDMIVEAIGEFRRYLEFGDKAVFRSVASRAAVEDEIEQLEEYLKFNAPLKPSAAELSR